MKVLRHRFSARGSRLAVLAALGAAAIALCPCGDVRAGAVEAIPLRGDRQVDPYEDLLREVRHLNEQVQSLNARTEALQRSRIPASLPPSERLPERPVPPLQPVELVRWYLGKTQEAMDRMPMTGDTELRRHLAVGYSLLSDQLDGKAKIPARGGPDLHVVGIYSGAEVPRSVSKSTVRVTCTDVPIVLCLCAYEEVDWTVDVAEGARLQKVILGGLSPQHVSGLPADVPVEEYFRPESGTGPMSKPILVYSYPGSMETGYPSFAATLERITGLKIVTFQGGGENREAQHVVGPESEIWRAYQVLDDARALYERATQPERAGWLAKLSSLKFQAVWVVSHQSRSVGDFTILGPIPDTLRPVSSSITRVAMDPVRQTLYGKEPNNLYVLDLDRGTTTRIAPKGQGTRIRWTEGITFDVERNRLLVSSTSDGGRIYAYYPDRDELLITESGPMCCALAYCAEKDVIYGLESGPGAGPGFEGRIAAIHVLDANLARIAEVRLTGIVAMGGNEEPQLISVGGHLIILIQASSLLGARRLPISQPRCYVVDPESGDVLYSGNLSLPAAGKADEPATVRGAASR